MYIIRTEHFFYVPLAGLNPLCRNVIYSLSPMESRSLRPCCTLTLRERERMLNEFHRALTMCALSDFLVEELYKQGNQVAVKQRRDDDLTSRRDTSVSESEIAEKRR